MDGFDCGAATHIGRRKNNEDAFVVDANLGLYVVADGMGGHEGGEVASRQTVASIRGFVERNRRDPGGTWPCAASAKLTFEENLLVAAIERAHLDVTAQRVGPLADMGSTVVALLARGRVVAVAHVGDSRAYRVRGGALERLTRDHSLQAEMQAQGTDFPYRNVITRAVGVSNHRADAATLELTAGESLLICSDGLYEALEDEEILSLLAHGEAQTAAAALVERAVANGGADNVTAVVVRAPQR